MFVLVTTTLTPADYDPGSFGGEEFEAQQDQASFLHELEQQEEKINKATLVSPPYHPPL